MNTAKYLFCIAIYLVSACSSLCLADVVWTQAFNYEGTIIEETSEYVVIQTGNRKKKILRSDIQDITYAAVVKEEPSENPKKTIGKWADRSILGGTITIYWDGTKLIFKQVFRDNSVMVKEVVRRTTIDGIRFDFKESNAVGDYFLIRSNGDLEARDNFGNSGMIATKIEITEE